MKLSLKRTADPKLAKGKAAPKAKTKPKRPKKSSRKARTKFVLVIGDEGGILIYMRGNTVLKRLFIPSPEAAVNMRPLNDLLAQDSKASLSLLVDMADQNYIRQSLPPVSRLSVNKLIKRRMDKDIAADDIKGSILLGREKEGRKDWNFMLVSTPSTGLLKQWIDYAAERDNPFMGIFLLPLEAATYIQEISNASIAETDSEWQLLVTHQKIGGFRQIILHNGKMVFTRMALPIGESVPDVIAGNIEHEISTTMEYLKRMGYQEGAGLDVIILVSQEIRNAISVKKIQATHVVLLTPYDVAQYLQLEQAAQPDDHFGDVVIGVFFGRLKKHILPLQTNYTQKLAKFRQAILGVKALSALAILAFLGLTGNSVYNSYNLFEEQEKLTKDARDANIELRKTEDTAEKLPGNLDKISDIVGMNKVYDVKNYRPLLFIKHLSGALHEIMTVDELDWKVENILTMTNSSDTRKGTADIHLRLFNPPEDPEEQKKHWSDGVGYLKKAFPDYDFKASGLPDQNSEDQTMESNFSSESKPQGGAEKNNVIITLTWPKSKEPPKP